MEQFIQKYQEDILGVLSGFDRLLLRGKLQFLSHVTGMMTFLAHVGVLLKDFGSYVEETSLLLKQASFEVAERSKRPNIYLNSRQVRKDNLAREIAEKDNVTEGLVCIIRTVEPCMSYAIVKDHKTHKLLLKSRLRKCLHLYHYSLHPLFGLIHARLQTWFPFPVQVYINGREYLARQLDQKKIPYDRYQNGFLWIQSIEKAQNIFNRMLRLPWPTLLQQIANEVNPYLHQVIKTDTVPYYWSILQSEWATDVMFKASKALSRIYPSLIRAGLVSFASDDVMRFLGKKIPITHNRFTGEVITSYKARSEGVRIRHRLKSNSLKMYDKYGCILRIETTINDPRDYTVYRPKEGEANGNLDWRPLRKGIADIKRRAEVAQASNERYLNALASIDATDPIHKLVAGICRPVSWNKQRLRPLNPWSEADKKLFHAINKGEYMLNGFRNRDLVEHLESKAHSSAKARRRAAARTTRKLRLLRAHGLIKKIPRTHRYQLTIRGRKTITAILETLQITLNQLNEVAA